MYLSLSSLHLTEHLTEPSSRTRIVPVPVPASICASVLHLQTPRNKTKPLELSRGRRALLLPFMQDGDNFFTKLDRSVLMAKLEKEQQEAAEKARRVEQETEAKARRLAEERSEIQAVSPGLRVGSGSGSGSQAGVEDGMMFARPRELNFSDDIEFKAIPADPMTVAETLVKVSKQFDWLGAGGG